jgi:hypothetical protein
VAAARGLAPHLDRVDDVAVLFRPELHEPLTETSWDDEWAQDAIRRIIEDADANFDPDGLWPVEEWDGWEAAHPMKDLYVGASGVIWGLDALRRRGRGETGIDLVAAARRTLEVWQDAPDYSQWDDVPSAAPSALLLGETGPLLVSWRLEPSPELAARLFARVRENVDNEAIEIMWGAPGTMLVAQAMDGWTGEERWAEVWRESAESVWSAREPGGLWTNRIYGMTIKGGLGPPHGLVGNVLALRPALDAGRREQLERETAEVLARTARTDNGGANWPRLAEGDGEDLRVQWCHGAPGIVTSAAEYLDEELLLAGAELIWQAGPPGMEKGSGICHGTAGNGYAFLKVFERTGDELWLDRARRFAVHGVEQVERRGKGRYSLFTGDVGVALYVADCLAGRSAFPVIDSL